MLELTYFNQSVRLTTNDYGLLNHIKRFLDRFYTSKSQGFSKYQQQEPKVFVSKLNNEGTYYFHVNQFLHLYSELERTGYKFEVTKKTDERNYKSDLVDFKVRSHWELRDYQKPIVDFILDNPVKSKLVPIQTGKGKAQPLDAKIKVPGGWSYMKDMKVGLTITAWDGSPTKVIGVYPQGVEKVYKVTFADGRSTECSENHLWEVYYSNQDVSDFKIVLDTTQLIKILRDDANTVKVITANHEDTNGITPNIDLYTKTTDLLTKSVNSGDMSVRFPLEYMYKTSYDQKLSIIQAAMDLNGNVKPNKGIVFSTTNYNFAVDIQYIVRAIGGIAKVILTDHKERGRQVYNVIIEYLYPERLFTQQYKQDKTIQHKPLTNKLLVTLSSVEYIGEKETQCISIDHPDSLYVTDDFIVTHNTFTALYSIAKLKQKLGVVILPTYIEKWVHDIANIHEAKTHDVMVVQGSKALAFLIESAKTGSANHDYYIFSTRTLQEYIKQYEENPIVTEKTYGCKPVDLFPLLGIGVMLIDESHQHFHAVFKVLIHTNVKLQIGLTATLLSDDYTVKKMHKIVYPDKSIYSAPELDKYTDVYAVSYSIPERFIKHVRTKAYGSTTYSHTAFEQSMTKYPDSLNRYVSLINSNIKDYYINDYKEKDKLLIFVSTVNFATALTNSLTQLYPALNVKRYCESDSYTDMLEGDIIVSTVISAGTAIDIPNLRVVIQTVSISSQVSNIQSLGRLRKLPDRDVKFVYLYAQNIGKQKEYHIKRMELFRDRVANITLRQSSSST